MKRQISPQYLQEDKIFVTIIEVKSPVYYVIKESPSMDTKCTYASKFLELEESMQKYYRSLEKSFFQLPVKDTVLVVEHEKKYYRAKVCSILNLPTSYLIKVYLVDYGKECSVPKSSLFEIQADFLSIPFQVVDFKLPGLEPMSLVLNPNDLSVEYGAATEWDPAADVFIQDIFKALQNAFIKVEGVAQNCIFGTLHVTLLDEEKCVNDELVFKKFAFQNPECWNDITRLSEILLKGNLESITDEWHSPSSNSEISVPSCVVSKSLPDSQLSSPETPKDVELSADSPIIVKPSKNFEKSGIEKLREILRAKKSPEQNKSTAIQKKESQPHSITEEKPLEQKAFINELEDCTATLLENIKDVCNKVNADDQTMEKHSTVRELTTTCEETNDATNVKDSPIPSKHTVSKTDENKDEQTVSATPKTSAFQKFREMVARKKAAQKQCIPQTLRDDSSTVCHSQSEMNSSLTGQELERSKILSQDLDISVTQMDSVESDLSPSAPTSVKTENAKVMNPPSNSVQEVGIAESVHGVKSDNKQSGELQVSSKEKEMSNKVDPAKVRAFFERTRKARALFLAQNQSEQSQKGTNSLQTATSPSVEPSKTGTQLVLSDAKIIVESSKSKTGAELITAEPSKIHESLELQIPKPTEEANSKVVSGNLKTSFEQNRKSRALFLAQTMSKQNQDGKSSTSDTISTPLIVRRPFESDKTSLVTPETQVSTENIIDILELANESSDSSSAR